MFHPVIVLGFIYEKEQINKDLFIKRIQNDSHHEVIRIPKQLTQEELPLNFQFYSALLPILNDLKNRGGDTEFQSFSTTTIKYIDNFSIKQQREVLSLRTDKMNANLSMINKFINLNHKEKILTSQL